MAKPPDAPPTRGVLRVSVSQSGSRAVVGGGEEEEEWEEEEEGQKTPTEEEEEEDRRNGYGKSKYNTIVVRVTVTCRVALCCSMVYPSISFVSFL